MVSRSEAEKLIIQNLRLVFQAIQRHSIYIEKQLGISSSQLCAMIELSMQPGLRVTDIADRMSIKNATASNMLDKIQSKQLIERKRESTDQRVVTLYLTEKGKKLLQQSNVPAQGVILSGLQVMRTKDVNILNASLRLLVDNILKYENLSTNDPV